MTDSNSKEDSLISVIIPVFNEESGIKEFVAELVEELNTVSSRYEIILIDDGSDDESLAVMSEIASLNKSIVLIAFTRNFGKESALSAGLEACRGGAAISIDSDFQHPINLVSTVINKWLQDHCLVIELVKQKRQADTLFKRLLTKCFYWVLEKDFGDDFDVQSDFKLLDRKVIEIWKGLPESTIFYRGLIRWMGFESTKVTFDPAERRYGVPSWKLRSLIEYGYSILISFSTRPLKLVFGFSLAFAMMASVLFLYTVIQHIFNPGPDGIPTVIVLILMTGSFILLSNGILGLYLANLMTEVKRRPRYIIKSIQRTCGDDS